MRKIASTRSLKKKSEESRFNPTWGKWRCQKKSHQAFITGIESFYSTRIQVWWKKVCEDKARQKRLDIQNRLNSHAEITSCLHIYECTRHLAKWEFANYFSTDGVSVRILMKKTEKKRKRSDDNSPFKPRGLYSIDALKHQSKLDLADMQILGVDPGKSNLLAIVDIDSKKQGRRNKLKRLQYTRQQRAFETNERKFAVLQKAEKPDTVVSAEKELSNNNSRSSHLHDDSQSTQHKGLLSYF